MQLPGRLSSSTLGDLLGALHRARVTGLLELGEIRGPRGRTVPGRLHRVHLREGLVAAVETALPAPPGTAPIDALFGLEEATVAFRTARPLPAAQLPPRAAPRARSPAWRRGGRRGAALRGTPHRRRRARSCARPARAPAR